MLTVQSTEAIRRIETAIGYTFKDKRLLVQVFTRKTYMKIDPEAPDNEVLEFYGDMLLSYHVTTYFVDKFAHMLNDGLYFMRTVEQFTDMRSHYVRNQYLTDRIKQLLPNIDRLVRAQNPRVELPKDNQKAYADLFESLVGAVYLDSCQNDKLIRSFILRHLNIEPKAEEAAISLRPQSPVTVLPSVSLMEDVPAPIEAAATVAEAMAEAVAESGSGSTSEPPADTPVEGEVQAEEALPAPASIEPLCQSLPEEEPASARHARRRRSSQERVPFPIIPAEEPPAPAEEPRIPFEERPAEAVTGEAAAPIPAAIEPAGLTKREELEAYCRAEGMEPPMFGEMPKNSPNARPVAACTVRFRLGKGKPVKISLNDSGKTPAEAEEKVAAKMLKKLMEQQPAEEKAAGEGPADVKAAKLSDTAQADASKNTAPTEEAPASPVSETAEPRPIADAAEATDAVALPPVAEPEEALAIEATTDSESAPAGAETAEAPFMASEENTTAEVAEAIEIADALEGTESIGSTETFGIVEAIESVENAEPVEKPKGAKEQLPVATEEKPKRASRSKKSPGLKPKAPSKAKKAPEPKVAEGENPVGAVTPSTAEEAPQPAKAARGRPAKATVSKATVSKATVAEATIAEATVAETAAVEETKAPAEAPKPRKRSTAKAKKEPVGE